MKFKSQQENRPGKPISQFLFDRRLTLSIIGFGILLVGFLIGILVQRGGLLGKLRLSTASAVNSGLEEVNQNIGDEIQLYKNNNLPTLAIDLKFKYYRQMLEKRDEALKVEILQTTDDDFVPGTISFNNGEKMDMKIRLKGDWTDHLLGKKWSFRIHLKDDDDQILGFRQFSIQTPETRNFLYEWAFHENLMQEGLLTTRYDFVNVMLNGELLGIYAIEENFSTELLESQGRRQGVILRFDEEDMWNKWYYNYANGIKFRGNGWSYTTERTADISTFQSGHIESSADLSAEAETARSLLRSYETGALSASEVFDVKLMGRYFALSDLWAACHGTTWHNLRFYYNPITTRLEPVVFDALPFSVCEKDEKTGNFIFDAGNSLLKDEAIRRAYTQELYRIIQPGYVEELTKKYYQQANQYSKSLLSEYDEKDLGIDWQSLLKRQKFLALYFDPPNPIKGAYTISGINPGDDGPVQLKIELTNLAPLPIDVVGFEINDELVDLGQINPATLASYSDTTTVPFYSEYVFELVDKPEWADPDHLPKIKAIIRLAGIEREKRVTLDGVMTPAEISMGPQPEASSISKIIKQYPFFYTNDTGNQLISNPGVWDIDGDLVIPGDVKLQIPAGTVLRFDPGAIILTHGPINLLGSESNPVLLTAKDPTSGWGGIVVLKSPAESLWKFAKIENTFGISRQGWILTGGITFFGSDIKLDHAIIGNNHTEDAINVVHGNFTFLDSRFENTFADAFDSDFSTGEIHRCNFENIQGDAVDISGTQASVSFLTLNNIVDKGLSIGENSHITATDLTMDTVGIGVASKDLSTVDLKNSTINNARFSGLAAYVKKPVYGPASITTENVSITFTDQLCVVQKGSQIILNGEDWPGKDIDVDKLYAEGILGN